jgi:hypothetical protein
MTNPWDSLMVCGFSYEAAERLVLFYALHQNINMPRKGLHKLNYMYKLEQQYDPK